MIFFVFFFFSSRRRHTRYIGDWSSDVCSSDLHDFGVNAAAGKERHINGRLIVVGRNRSRRRKSLISPIAVEAQRRQPRFARRLALVTRGTNLRLQGFPFGPGYESLLDALLHIGWGHIEKTERVCEL